MRADGSTTPGAVDLAALVDAVERGRGAPDAVLIPVPAPTPGALAEVRSTVRAVVAAAVRPAQAGELQVVCTELVSNAVLHGAPPVRLLLHEAPDEIVVAVHDGSLRRPRLGTGPTSGLRIVDELTAGAWGAFTRGRAKWVWAALPRLLHPRPRAIDERVFES